MKSVLDVVRVIGVGCVIGVGWTVGCAGGVSFVSGGMSHGGTCLMACPSQPVGKGHVQKWWGVLSVERSCGEPLWTEIDFNNTVSRKMTTTLMDDMFLSLLNPENARNVTKSLRTFEEDIWCL